MFNFIKNKPTLPSKDQLLEQAKSERLNLEAKTAQQVYNQKVYNLKKELDFPELVRDIQFYPNSIVIRYNREPNYSEKAQIAREKLWNDIAEFDKDRAKWHKLGFVKFLNIEAEVRLSKMRSKQGRNAKGQFISKDKLI